MNGHTTRTTEVGEWLRPADVARSIGTGNRTVYNAIASRELRCARPNGRDIRIHRSWVGEWLAGERR